MMQCTALLALLALLGLEPTTTATLQHDDSNVRVRRSDDVSLLSLQTVVQQQASMLQTVQAELTASNNRVSSLDSSLQALQTSHQALQSSHQALQSKVDATSKAVAFSARISDSQDSSSDGVSLGQHQTVVFNEAMTNIGNGYDTHTGIFTAPVAGLYAFFLSQMTPSTHGHLYLDILKNGDTVLDRVFSQGDDAEDYDQGSSLVSTHIRQASGDAVRASFWTIFTGFLLQAD